MIDPHLISRRVLRQIEPSDGMIPAIETSHPPRRVCAHRVNGISSDPLSFIEFKQTSGIVQINQLLTQPVIAFLDNFIVWSEEFTTLIQGKKIVKKENIIYCISFSHQINPTILPKQSRDTRHLLISRCKPSLSIPFIVRGREERYRKREFSGSRIQPEFSPVTTQLRSTHARMYLFHFLIKKTIT